jgi:hypothetical protein
MNKISKKTEQNFQKQFEILKTNRKYSKYEQFFLKKN